MHVTLKDMQRFKFKLDYLSPKSLQMCLHKIDSKKQEFSLFI